MAEKKTIWVTGSKGQLGTEIYLQQNQLQNAVFHFTDVVEVDLTDEIAVFDFAKKNKPDYIINCAAYTAVDKAETDIENAKKLNETIPQNLVNAAKVCKAILIHISTDYVFNGKAWLPYCETDGVNPESVYGETKLLGEKAVLAYEKSIIVRTSWLYSAHGNNFVKTMIRLGNEREKLGVVFDQTGSPTNAADLAAALLVMVSVANLPTHFQQIFHYSNEGLCSWYDFALKIMELTNINCTIYPITSDQYPLPAKRPAYSVLNKSKIKSAFNIDIPHWEASLKKVIDQLKF